MPKRPNGEHAEYPLAPDGQAFPGRLDPYWWGPADRERAAYRSVPGGKSYETAVAVTGPTGEAIDKSTVQLLGELVIAIERMRVGLVQAGYAKDVTLLNELDL